MLAREWGKWGKWGGDVGTTMHGREAERRALEPRCGVAEGELSEGQDQLGNAGNDRDATEG